VTHIGSLKLVPDYLASLAREATVLSENSRSGDLHTVYFGGGTPSMLQPDQIESVLTHMQDCFGFAPDCEITIEAHPLTVDQQRLSGYHLAGVTRISFGAESMRDSELKRLGRRHTAAQVEQAVRSARNVGFTSVALDLMYGLPGQTVDSWRATLERALALRADHLSLYPLSIEPRTVFGRKLTRGQLELPADELVVGMYHEACTFLRLAGYEHYEVANWARAGKRCAHNMAYWMNQEVLAVGVGLTGM
jgi:oxygen-independent coproporphyrinogen-3 oxidase